jgi:Tfp pilus assembly protein PilX
MKRIQTQDINRLAGNRGVTMISVMLLVISLMTLGLLVVRSSIREVTQAGQLVARERALMVAQAAVDYAAAQYRSMEDDQVSKALAGDALDDQGVNCTQADKSCIPGGDPDSPTGMRNAVLSGAPVDCAGRACMRQGAVVRLPNQQTLVPFAWCGANGGVAFNQIVANGDPEARVCVWIRNNTADALGAAGSGDWVTETDNRVVLTAMATVRNTTVTVEQEIVLAGELGPQVWQPQAPDEGYGGGHNNDNSSVNVCKDHYQTGSKP